MLSQPHFWLLVYNTTILITGSSYLMRTFPGPMALERRMWLFARHVTSYSYAHYGDVIMSPMASQNARLTILCSNVYSGTDQRKPKSSAWLAFVWGIHRWPVNSPHKGWVTRNMFPFGDPIMVYRSLPMYLICHFKYDFSCSDVLYICTGWRNNCAATR